MSLWFIAALTLPDITDYQAFLALATELGINHAYSEKHYLQVVAAISKHKTEHNSWEDAWASYKREVAAHTVSIEARITGAVPTNSQRLSRCCGNDPPTPSMLAALKTGGYALAKWVGSGFKLVSAEVQDRRLSACEQCEFVEIAAGRCRKCGCFVKIKTWMATESCPEEKW